jgi:hypothetical protein
MHGETVEHIRLLYIYKIIFRCQKNCVNYERIVGHSKKLYQVIGVCLEGLRKTTRNPSRKVLDESQPRDLEITSQELQLSNQCWLCVRFVVLFKSFHKYS